MKSASEFECTRTAMLGLFGMLIASTVVFAGAAFRNPLYQGEDPWVIQKWGYYYSSYSGPENPHSIYIAKSSSLMDQGPRVKVYDGPGVFVYLFSPELHFIDGHWYIYATAHNLAAGKRHCYVWKATTDNPQDTFTLVGPIITRVSGAEYENGDLTVFKSEKDGKLYMITNVIGKGECIAPMDSPTSVHAEFIPLPALYGEGPRLIQRNGRIFCTNAGGFWRYCNYHITMAECASGNVLDPNAWKYQGEVFSPNGEWTDTSRGHFFNKDGNWKGTVYENQPPPTTQFIPTKGNMWGTSRACFVKSADGTEDWMVYHHKVWPVDENGYRQISIQKFTWNPDGTPNFGSPVQTGALQQTPSGDPGLGTAYEAENATLIGKAAVKSDHEGFNGKGFVSNLLSEGDGVRFTVNAPIAGFHIVTLRYANGDYVAEEQQYNAKRNDAAPSHLTVYVNGKNIKRTALDKTRNYDQWMHKAESLTLNAGQNHIEYKMDTDDEGKVALDNLWIYHERTEPTSKIKKKP